MRILVVSQYFWPENFRINDLCVELVNRGHEVTVLTGKPNYPDGEVFKEYLTSPSHFNYYSGCNVVRVPMSARGKNSTVKLALNYLTFALSATFIGAWLLRRKQFDVIFVFGASPVTVALPAIFLKKLKKSPVVFWVLDLWPETLEAVGVVKSQRLLSFVGNLVSFIYNRCDLILGQSKAFYEGISRYCQDTSKIKYFPSWSEDIFENKNLNLIECISENQGVFKLLFAGNIGDAQDFPSIINAMLILKKQEIKVKLFVVGDGRALDYIKKEVSNQKLNDYIIFLGRHPLEDMPNFYASADALLVSLREDPVFSMTIPGKIQSYMMAGKPILTMLSGEGSRVVKEAECGFISKSGDYRQLAQNIVRMNGLSTSVLNEMGLHANDYAHQEFDRQVLINQLEEWLDNIKGKNCDCINKT